MIRESAPSIIDHRKQNLGGTLKYKATQLTILPIIFFAMLPTALADTPPETSLEDIQKETRDLLSTLKDYTYEQRDEAVAKTEKALERFDKRIDELEKKADERWDEMNKTARTETRESLRELRKSRTELAEWFGSMKNSSSDAWQHMKEGFGGAYASLSKAWTKAQREFTEDDEQ
jgi:mevalonate kinase